MKGHEVATKVAKDGKITIKFNMAGDTWKALRDYGHWFDSAIGIYTRDICEPYHNAWKDVDPQHKRKKQDCMLVFAKLYSYKFLFNLNIIKPLIVLAVL